MLVPGGLYQQPAGRWFAQAYAGYVWGLLDMTSKPGFNWAQNALSQSDLDLIDKCNQVRQCQTSISA